MCVYLAQDIGTNRQGTTDGILGIADLRVHRLGRQDYFQ